MKRQEAAHSLIGLAVAVLFVAFVLGSASTSSTLAQISPRPTPTWTRVPPKPTNTPKPPQHDTKPPTSRVRHLKRVQFTRSFTVRWKGRDRGKSGVRCYDVQYKDGPAGTWQDWVICTSLTSFTFHGEWGHRYFFRVRALDNAGNVEAWPSKPDTQTYLQQPE